MRLLKHLAVLIWTVTWLAWNLLVPRGVQFDPPMAFAINIKAEQEIEVILQHLEYQNAILIAMVEKLGVNIEKTVRPK
jgi:hypothetical protein